MIKRHTCTWLSKRKIKAKLSCAHHKGIHGSAGTAPLILNLGNMWKCVVSFMLWPLYPQENSPWYPQNRTLGGPQSWSRHLRRREKSLAFPMNWNMTLSSSGANWTNLAHATDGIASLYNSLHFISPTDHISSKGKIYCFWEHYSMSSKHNVRKNFRFRISWHKDKMKQTNSISKMRQDELTCNMTVTPFKKSGKGNVMCTLISATQQGGNGMMYTIREHSEC
jgi:hypothetical protein